MPTQVPTDIDSKIIESISRCPDGVGISNLLDSFADFISRRSLQRRLANLVEEGRLKTEGEGRALRYGLPSVGSGISASVRHTVEVSIEADVPITPESEEIKAFIRQPRQQRRPVSYNQDFLESYRPNETAYLPESLRKQLHGMGRSPMEDQPAGTFARDILNRLLIDLSWASSRLEGNTYSRLDTERLIDFGQAAEGKDAIETQMVLNHKAAIEMLVEEAGSITFNPWSILNLHAILSDGLLADIHTCGRIRTRAVEIGGSVFLPVALPQRIEELFRLMLSKAEAITDPFEQSFFIMVQLPYLQPFEDVNKRVSRLSANIPLIRHNLCPLSFIDVPVKAYIEGTLGVYELQRFELLRDVFVWAYERSCQQYVAVRQSLVPPDRFRLRYRAELTEAVGRIVRERRPSSLESVGQVIPPTVVPEDQEHFFGLVLQELEDLYEGNISRFRLRPSEYTAWRMVKK